MHLDENILLEQIAHIIDRKLEVFFADHPLAPQLLYTRVQAANLLGTSLSTLKKLISRGDLRVRRWGSSVLVPHDELVRISKKDIEILWPERPNGKTTDELSGDR